MLALTFAAALPLLARSAYLQLWEGDVFYLLASGRLIVEQGLPHTNTWTVVTAGAPWVDQQWLGQIIAYGIFVALGTVGMLLFSVGLTSAGMLAAWRTARLLGANPARLIVIVLPAVLVLVQFSMPRSQSFAFALWPALLLLLICDVRRPQRRWLVIALVLLVVWANVHGTAPLGVIAVVLALAESAWRRRRPLREAVGFALAALLTPLATPYLPGLIGYYRSLVLNDEIARYITEWRAPTLRDEPVFMLIVAVAIALVAARPRRLPVFASLLTLLTAAAAAWSMRNMALFVLTAIAFLPVLLEELRPVKPETATRLSQLSWLAVIPVVAVSLVAALRPIDHPPRLDTPGFATRLADELRTDPQGKVFVSEMHANALLWHAPQFAGRVAFDARIELLPKGCLTEIAGVFNDPDSGLKRLNGYRYVVTMRNDGRALTSYLKRHARVVDLGDGMVLFDRGLQDGPAGLCHP